MRTRHIYSGLTLAAAALLCLTGCKKNDEGEKVVLGTQFEKAVSVQKTYLGDENIVCWHDGDSILVNGKVCYIHDNKVDVEPADQYIAKYPVNDHWKALTANLAMPKIEKKQTYIVDRDGRQVINGPMYARLDSKSGILYFKNLYSLLKVTVSTDEKPFRVTSIRLNTMTGNVVGGYDVYINGPTGSDAASAPLIKGINGGAGPNLVLYCGKEGIEIAPHSDSVFYLVVVPSSADGEGITIEKNLSVYVRGVMDGKSVIYTYNSDKKHKLDRSCIGGVGINLQQLQQERDYVDLGLPSGTLWATCNVGAARPWNYGGYYAWAETEEKETYMIGNYKWGAYTSEKLRKYTNEDGLTTLEATDDAAIVNWGNEWRTPTNDEFQELNTNFASIMIMKTWIDDYQGTGIAGKIFVNTERWWDTLFLPAAGEMGFSNTSRPVEGESTSGLYWTSTLSTTSALMNNRTHAYIYGFYSMGTAPIADQYRMYGLSVRPVRSKNN